MDSIKNFIQLTDTIATAGQPRVEQFQSIADAGYQHVINLGLAGRYVLDSKDIGLYAILLYHSFVEL